MAFTSFRDVVSESSPPKKILTQQVEAAHVLEVTTRILGELFGEALATHAKPLYLKNRTLTITCASAAVAQEIRLNQQAIVQKINDTLGKKEVDRIRYLA